MIDKIKGKRGISMFSIGDKVVYPMHGAGTIESIEEQEMFGDTAEYYIIKMPVGDMKVMVPTESAAEIGVREVSDSSIAPSVFAVLEKPKEEYVYENNWNRSNLLWNYNNLFDALAFGPFCCFRCSNDNLFNLCRT